MYNYAKRKSYKKCEYLLVNHLGNKLTTRGVRDIIDKVLYKRVIDSLKIGYWNRR